MSDNGPQFSSHEFKNFAKDYEFKHVTSSPKYPKSNGEAESAVKVIKRMLSKCKHDKTDPYIGLLNLRNTPKNHLPSPAQLLFSRELNTKILTNNKLLKPKVCRYDQVKFNRYKASQEKYYNKTARNLQFLDANQDVFFKKQESDTWTPGKIVAKVNEHPRSYRVADEKGKEYRRNRVHIYPKTPTGRNEQDGSNTSSPLVTSPPNSQSTEKPDSNNQTSQSTEKQVSKNQTSTVSRSGRTIRRPLRLAEYWPWPSSKEGEC